MEHTLHAQPCTALLVCDSLPFTQHVIFLLSWCFLIVNNSSQWHWICKFMGCYCLILEGEPIQCTQKKVRGRVDQNPTDQILDLRQLPSLNLPPPPSLLCIFGMLKEIKKCLFSSKRPLPFEGKETINNNKGRRRQRKRKQSSVSKAKRSIFLPLQTPAVSALPFARWIFWCVALPRSIVSLFTRVSRVSSRIPLYG